MMHPTMIPHLGEFTAKMAKAGLRPLVCDTFAHYYRKLVGGATGLIHDVDILPMPPGVGRRPALRTEGAVRTVRIVPAGWGPPGLHRAGNL
jgi:hypothetical protein